MTFYFDPKFPINGHLSPRMGTGIKRLAQSLIPPQEILALVERDSEVEVEAEYLASLQEAEDWLAKTPPAVVHVGLYPDWPNDTRDVITRVVPDADGVIRNHPH